MGKRSTEYKFIKEKHCFSTQALCQILDISRQTLSDWEKAGCSKISRGWWCIDDVLRWRGLVGNGLKTEAEAKTDKEKTSLHELKLTSEVNLKQAQAEAAQIKNKVSQGEYLEKSAVVEDLHRFLTVFKKSLQNLSRKISAEYAHYVDEIEARRIEVTTSKIINDALNQLSITGVYEKSKVKR